MQVTVTFNLNESKASLQKQLNAWNTLLAGQGNAPTTEETEVDLSADETEDAPPAKKTRGKKSAPENTVSEEEDEDFGSKAVDEDELEEEEADDAEEEEETLPWETVKEAINKYGNKHPDGMKAILLSFNFKTTKELQQHKNKWEPVYRKVMAKLKAAKKAK